MKEASSSVGYGRPPAGSRFRPGQSGNPSGRPKARPSFSIDLAAELAETLPPSGERGEPLTKQRAIVKKLVSAAVEGDVKAATALINLCSKLLPEADDDPQAGDDDAFLDQLAQRQSQAQSGSPASSNEPEGGK